MENGARFHSWDVCLCGRITCDSEIVQDIKERMILHWNYRNLRELPEEILNHGEHIEEIYLKRNCLEKLPSDIGKLKNLTNLYLVGNQLTCLPDQIGDLNSLKVLDVSQNYLQQLPESLGQLKFLESLLLTYNQLEELSLKCLKNLNRLKQLELSGNKIRSISSSVVDGLASLEELGVDRNPISFLPRNICQLRNLRYLSACRCNLLYLPSLPFHCVSTRSSRNPKFLFDGNPKLNYIPYWALQQLDTSVECFGCSLEPGETCPTDPLELRPPGVPWREHACVKLVFKCSLHTLHFDQDILQLNRKSVKVPTLLEICLRKVYVHDLLNNPVPQCPVNEPLIVARRAETSAHVTTSYISSPPQPLQSFLPRTNPEDNLLPTNLQQILQLGPVAKCFQCMAPVFTQSWPVTFQIPENILEEREHLGKLNLSCTHFCSGSCIIKFAHGSSFSSNLLLNDLRCIIDREVVWFQ